MKIFQLSLLIIGVAYSTAIRDVEVTLHSYSNPTHQDCNGAHCEGLLAGNCDNFFDFCLREVGGGSSCLTPNITTGYIEEDVFTFGESELNQLEIDNPLKFSSISSSSELELIVEVTDDDIIGDDPVDTIVIPITQQNSPTTFTGPCGRASIMVSIQITDSTPSPNPIPPPKSSSGSSGSVALYAVVGIFAGVPMLA